MLKPHDDPLEVFNRQISFDNLEDFYTENREPALWGWNMDFMKRFKIRGDRPIVVLVSRNTDEEILEEYLTLTHSYLGKEEVYFSHIDLTASNLHMKARQIIETKLGVHWTDMPTLRAISPDKHLINWNQMKYQETAFKFNSMKRFIRNLIKGDLKEHKRSQALPEPTKAKPQPVPSAHQEKSGEGEASAPEEPAKTENPPIQVVVRENFEAEVTQSKTNVVVFLSGERPWCDNCPEIESVLEVVQKDLREQGKTDVRFVKYDVYRNELENWMFVESPELVFFHKDGGNDLNLSSLENLREGVTPEKVKKWIISSEAGGIDSDL